MTSSFVFVLASLAGLGYGHGIVTTPPVRSPGPASLAAGGHEVTNILKADNQSGIESLYAASGRTPGFDPAKCNLVLCKGLKLEDNWENVQTYHPSEVVNMKVWTRIPHKGWASVAIMDTKSQPVPLMIGTPLLSFETDSATGFSATVAPIDMGFNITIPETLHSRCEEPGDCVLQWTWFGRVVHQTYESCVDFAMPEGADGVETVVLDNPNSQARMQED